MRRIAALLVLTVLALAAPASAEGPRLVRVQLSGTVTLRALREAGLDVTRARDGAWADLLEWPGDEARLAALGAAPRVLDADPGATAAARSRADRASRPPHAAGRAGAAVAPIEGEGALAGFWTLAEVKAKLDALVASDTRGLVADKLDTLGWSIQHRPIWGLELGLQSAPATRPVAFFNALTHAREPEGMQALLHFADDLLATYDADPVSKYLLEHRRIYLVPVVNPDGYWINQRIYDSTAAFGYWRKNLRDTDLNHRSNNGDGIDLNRNYGFQFGYDDIGSSPTLSNQTYRGPSAFSEPETRAQRDAVSALQPVTGFSFHTYGDVLLHPWGWTPAASKDSTAFQLRSDELSAATGYTAGPSPRVLYSVNGEFNDWCYGDTLLKPRMYSWTPEVGEPDDDFWPPPSRIVPLAESMLRPSRTLAGLAGPWVSAAGVSIAEGALPAGHLAHLSVVATNLGASGQAGPGLTGALTSLDAGVWVAGGPAFYPTLASLQSAPPLADFLVAADDTVTPGRLARFRVDFTDDAGLHCRDTIAIVVGTPTAVYVNACSSTSGLLVTGGWGVTSNDPVHPDAYLTDSPGGLYATQMNASIQPLAPLNLSNGIHAWVAFESRWMFENDYDGALIEASLDGQSWTALSALASTPSNAAFAAGADLPVLAGSRWRWRGDLADLGAFAGHTGVRLRVRSVSDPGFQLDGLSVDSLRVLIYDPAAQPAPVSIGPGVTPQRLSFAPPAPSPAGDHVRFAVELPPGASGFALEVLDVQGRRVVSYAPPAARAGERETGESWRWSWNLRDDAGRRVPPGLYLAHVRCSAGDVVRRVVVLP